MGSHLLKGEAHPRVELSVVRIDDFGLGLEDTLLPENAQLNQSFRSERGLELECSSRAKYANP